MKQKAANTQTYGWIDPLACARKIASEHKDMCFLYSAADSKLHTTSPRLSIIAYRKKNMIQSESFRPLECALSLNSSCGKEVWFGYLGYELLHELESIPLCPPSLINMPSLWFQSYHTIIRFDHTTQTCEISSDIEADRMSPPKAQFFTEDGQSNVISMTSNMTKESYLEKVGVLKEAIARGDIFQANLTRKIIGEFDQSIDYMALFVRLCAVSPSFYSCYIQCGKYHILSSSPECFLKISNAGQVTAMPIKGTAVRYQDPLKDHQSKMDLMKSEKDRAENLMIVDLMRNDFSRGATINSVQVTKLFDVQTFPTIHHLVSIIEAQKSEEVSTLEFIKRCFPPGSMTGAPKVKAMELCSILEQVKRGVYSGALGWIDADGSAEFSVVIRTLIGCGKSFEFQVGGAIVADSDPELEWKETQTKAAGILRALGV